VGRPERAARSVRDRQRRRDHRLGAGLEGGVTRAVDALVSVALVLAGCVFIAVVVAGGLVLGAGALVVECLPRRRR
jgi:hypothetical protein